MQPSPLWKVVQNANYKNPACPQIIHSILHQVFEPAIENQTLTDITIPTTATVMLFYHIYLFIL